MLSSDEYFKWFSLCISSSCSIFAGVEGDWLWHVRRIGGNFPRWWYFSSCAFNTWNGANILTPWQLVELVISSLLMTTEVVESVFLLPMIEINFNFVSPCRRSRSDASAEGGNGGFDVMLPIKKNFHTLFFFYLKLLLMAVCQRLSSFVRCFLWWVVLVVACATKKGNKVSRLHY